LGDAALESDDMPFVTVIVPMHNERARIGECLDSLLKSDYPIERLEILVLDAASDDGSRDIVLDRARESDAIRLLENPRRIAAAAMNIGIENSEGDVIIILSAHSYVATNFIRQNVLHLAKTGASCVGGTIHSVSGSSLGKTIALAMSSPFGVGNALFRYSRQEQYVDTLAPIEGDSSTSLGLLMRAWHSTRMMNSTAACANTGERSSSRRR